MEPTARRTVGPCDTKLGRKCGVMSMWKTIQQETREVVWLASVVGGLSALGVGLAVVVVAMA
jgi:hypothetical protein